MAGPWFDVARELQTQVHALEQELKELRSERSELRQRVTSLLSQEESGGNLTKALVLEALKRQKVTRAMQELKQQNEQLVDAAINAVEDMAHAKQALLGLTVRSVVLRRQLNKARQRLSRCSCGAAHWVAPAAAGADADADADAMAAATAAVGLGDVKGGSAERAAEAGAGGASAVNTTLLLKQTEMIEQRERDRAELAATKLREAVERQKHASLKVEHSRLQQQHEQLRKELEDLRAGRGGSVGDAGDGATEGSGSGVMGDHASGRAPAGRAGRAGSSTLIGSRRRQSATKIQAHARGQATRRGSLGLHQVLVEEEAATAKKAVLASATAAVEARQALAELRRELEAKHADELARLQRKGEEALRGVAEAHAQEMRAVQEHSEELRLQLGVSSQLLAAETNWRAPGGSPGLPQKYQGPSSVHNLPHGTDTGDRRDLRERTKSRHDMEAQMTQLLEDSSAAEEYLIHNGANGNSTQGDDAYLEPSKEKSLSRVQMERSLAALVDENEKIHPGLPQAPPRAT